jgi:hypothetical protein
MNDKEQLTERAQLVRLYEASCGIDFPTDDERNFRRSLMIKLGLTYGLKEVRNGTIDGPKNPQPPRLAKRT